MYAPFGGGVLIGPSAVLGDAEPMLAGGGAVTYVTTDDVQWASLPDRHEAGSPNVVGAIALGAACTVLDRTGMSHIGAHEKRLLAYLDGQIDDLPNLHRLRLWDGPDVDRLGVSTFTVDGMHHALVASVLSAEYAIGVRHGCFCAHPYITHLLGVSIARRAHDSRAAPPRRAPGDPRRDPRVVRHRDHRRAHRPPRRRARARSPRAGRISNTSRIRTPATTCRWVTSDACLCSTFLPPLEEMATPSGCGQF